MSSTNPQGSPGLSDAIESEAPANMTDAPQPVADESPAQSNGAGDPSDPPNPAAAPEEAPNVEGSQGNRPRSNAISPPEESFSPVDDTLAVPDGGLFPDDPPNIDDTPPGIPIVEGNPRVERLTNALVEAFAETREEIRRVTDTVSPEERRFLDVLRTLNDTIAALRAIPGISTIVHNSASPHRSLDQLALPTAGYRTIEAPPNPPGNAGAPGERSQFNRDLADALLYMLPFANADPANIPSMMHGVARAMVPTAQVGLRAANAGPRQVSSSSSFHTPSRAD
jgi:hypothetical protein